jgi:hypothetical protein
MGSYQNPIGKPDPYDKYRAEPIEPTQQRPGDSTDSPPQKSKRGLAAHLLQILQRALHDFLSTHTGHQKDEGRLKEHLLSLKISLEILKAEDRSQDIVFLNDLATAWNEIIQFNADANPKFKLLIKKILHYPEHQRHTFGYYLTEYAGQKWIPFPYMELIHKIHAEHEKNPPSSPLTEWTLLLEEILNLLNDN